MMPDCSDRWRAPKIIAVLLLVFCSGIVAGVVAHRANAFQIFRKASGPKWREGNKEISLQRFRKELNLTNVQAQQVETVLDDFMTYYQTLQSQMDEVRASGKERIVRILDENQRRKFEQMLNDMQARQLR